MITPPRYDFLNSYVDSLTRDEALAWMASCIQSRRPHNITAINANKLWQMSKNERLAAFVKSSDLIIPEWAVVWGAEKLGVPLKAHIRGVMLLKSALPWAEERGYRPFFLGAKPDVIEQMVVGLKRNYPNLEVAGNHHGYFSIPAEHAKVRKLIQQSQADMLFVALGTPKQEFWIEENLTVINVPVAMGVGGSFDVIAGLKQDAPDWARGNGLEWIYRLVQDPKAYWKRYLVTNTWFVWQVIKACLRDTNIGVK